MTKRTRAAAALAIALGSAAAHAQFVDDFDDPKLEGWTITTSADTTAFVSGGKLVVTGNGADGATMLLDQSLADPAGYVAAEVTFDLELDITGRPIEVGVEVQCDPATGAGLIFGVFPNNPGGPGATIGLRESADGPLFKLAAAPIAFDLDRVFVRLRWTESEYRLTLSNPDAQSQGPVAVFTIQTPPPTSATGVSLFARPTRAQGAAPGSGDWSATFDSFRARPDTTRGCAADVNGDGAVTPADFNAWIIAYNNDAPGCDQNGDDLCTPADFNGWIINFNDGCNP